MIPINPSAFESDDFYGIPLVYSIDRGTLGESAYTDEPDEADLTFFEAPQDLQAFDGLRADYLNKGVHFFRDDAKFECVWKDPQRYGRLFQQRGAGCVLSPDFSVYVDHPRAVQIFNVFRNRYVAAVWQQQYNLPVVPTVSWADIESYEYCFCGIEEGGVVAVSTIGALRTWEIREMWSAGFQAMQDILKPRMILLYGRAWFELPNNVIQYSRDTHGNANDSSSQLTESQLETVVAPVAPGATAVATAAGV